MATVFIVDDNRGWVQKLTAEFDRHEEFKVVGVQYDGLLALESIRKKRPDVLLVDMILPGADGVSIVESVRNDMPSYNPIIVIVSAHGNDAMTAYLNKLGVDHYSMKIAPLAIIQRVKGLMRARMAVNEEKLIEQTIRELGLKDLHESTITVAAAVQIVLHEPDLLITRDVYPRIAAVRGSNEKAVEKNIRNAAKKAGKQPSALYKKLFQEVGIPTNNQFIKTLATYINENFR